MRTIKLMCFVSVMYSLLGGISWAAVAEPIPSPKLILAQNSSTEDELLMYYDEQELVTANKRPTSLRRAPAIATIITADEIRNMGARNLSDILKMVPGFGISVNELGKTNVEVRGIRTSTSEKILLMIDGHALNKNVTGSGFYNVGDVLPVENIKQVEIVRGPGSALYGTSAFVATINVITRNSEEINGLELKTGAGTFNTFKVNAVAGKAIGDKLTISASVDHFQTTGPHLAVPADALTPTGTSLAPGTTDSSLKQTDIFLKVGYGNLSFRGHYLTKRQGGYIGAASAINEGSYDSINNFWGELAHDLNISENIISSMKLRYDYYDQDPYVKIFPNGALGIYANGAVAIPQVKNRNIGVEEQLSWDAYQGQNLDVHLIAGASFDVLRQYGSNQKANYDPATPLLPPPAPYLPTPLGTIQQVANWNRDVTRETWATYFQSEVKLMEKLNLTAGVRYDHYSDFGDTTNPRLAVVWSVLENADLKLLYGRAFRAPNFAELYTINNPSQTGNPNLKPEKIETYEAALAYRLNRFFAVDLTYFYSTIDDLINVNFTTSPSQFANMGKAITQGVELGINGSCESGIYWKLSYAWQEPRDAITNKPLPYVPAQRAKASLNYALNRYVNLHTDLLWTGVRPREQGDTRSQLPAYFTTDMAVTFRNFFKTLEIQAAVKNLFDQKYSDPDLSGASDKVPGDYPRPGISALITASYKF